MRFKVENLHDIESADVELNGITVLLGNCTPVSSTIGKALTTAYAALSEGLIDLRADAIENALIRNCTSACKGMLSDIEQAYCRRRAQELIADPASIQSDEPECIKDILAIEDKRILQETTTRIFNQAFNGQVHSWAEPESPAKISIETECDNTKLVFTTSGDCCDIEGNDRMYNRAFYIEDSSIIAELNTGEYNELFKQDEGYLTDKEKLHLLLQVQDNNVVNLTITKDSICYKKLCDYIQGHVEITQGKYALKHQDIKSPIFFENLNPGLRSFVLLRMLLESGELKQHDILVFNEPEAHLDVYNRNLFAELLALLQKEFGIRVFITTNCASFASRVESMALWYMSAKKIKCYVMEQEDRQKSIVSLGELGFSSERIK
jgi:hypothetical protein